MPSDPILSALSVFAESVSKKLNLPGSGQPEEQLRAPFEHFLISLENPFGLKIAIEGETHVERLGRPDFAVYVNGLLAGYVELKQLGKGAEPVRFKGHDKRQWERFKNLPNILYTDGNSWGLYRDGSLDGRLVHFSGDIAKSGAKAVHAEDSGPLGSLLRNFLLWDPIIPKSTKELAQLLAPLCRMLRDDVTEALAHPESPLVVLAKDWRDLLFPDAEDAEFADAYAQTVTFALLLARSENADTLDLHKAITALVQEHSLLSRALQVLTDTLAQDEVSASLRMLQRVIDRIPAADFEDPRHDPWLYFYEDFLAAYDSELRKDAGAYYTPVNVVQAQVRLVDDILRNRLNKHEGFADPGVFTLDPAVGTGTYLLGIVKHALGIVENREGSGAIPAQAGALAKQLFGFETMVGPYAVAQLRVSRALVGRGATLPKDGPGIYLTDTLESPHTEPLRPPLILQPLAEQHQKALQIKDNTPVLVCIGNPPYGRHDAAEGESRKHSGGWVRWGDMPDHADAILKAFTEPAKQAGHGGDLKNLYNLYIYFWRWSLWKVFEHKLEERSSSGVVSFITASSYIDGDAFSGMREHLRRICDEVWVLDLGGEGRGTRQEENVFNIQTPVAIAMAVRYGEAKPDEPARVWYARIAGNRGTKLKRLEEIEGLESVEWRQCPGGWQEPFRPEKVGRFFEWPDLLDLFPWQQSGIKVGRTWVIDADKDSLLNKWNSLLAEDVMSERSKLFKESPTGRKITDTPSDLLQERRMKSIAESKPSTPTIHTYHFRSFDRQFILADARCIDRPSPSLWQAHSQRQIYISTLFTQPLGEGPALTAASGIPDLHYFRGSFGAKDIIPLYRDSSTTSVNILPGLFDILSKTYGFAISADDFASHIYALLAHPGYALKFWEELEHREIRVPLTKSPALFTALRDIGRRLIWLHTYGERFQPAGVKPGQFHQGTARCINPIPDTPEGYPDSFEYNELTKILHVGVGEFGPVSENVFEYQVSGLQVVQSWLGYRMKSGHGKKSSPLDDIRPERWTREFTTELLKLLWILEATVEMQPKQAELLAEVLAGPLFLATELPAVPEWARKPPQHPKAGQERKSLLD